LKQAVGDVSVACTDTMATEGGPQQDVTGSWRGSQQEVWVLDSQADNNTYRSVILGKARQAGQERVENV